MKREDFFEALSDIDENMVAAAEENSEAAKPVIVTAKKSYKKPVFTAAACLLLAAAVAVTAVIVKDKLPSTPIAPIVENNEYKTVVTVINGSKYPDIFYHPFYDYSDVEYKYIGDEYPNYPNPSKFKSYEELADYSQLIVMGYFPTESGQVAQTYELPDFSQAMTGDYFNKYITFNAFKVEKVLKSNGKVWAGDEILITQPYTIYTHSIDEYPSNEDIPTLYSFSQLTPMVKGDKWVYFLTENSGDHPEIFGDQTYSAVNDYEGRYPVPDEENPYFEYRENTNGVVAPAVFNQDIYSELKEKLENADVSKRPSYELEYEKVIDIAAAAGYENNFPTGLNIKFEMEEFEGTSFSWQGGKLSIREEKNSELNITDHGGTGVYILPYIYLCDLNGDGKREICFSVSFGSGIVHQFIWVWDYSNDKMYYISERGEYNYSLEKKDGELYCIKSEFEYSYNGDVVAEQVLTFDMLTEVGTEPEQIAVESCYDSSDEKGQSNSSFHKVYNLRDEEDDVSADLSFVFDIEGLPGVTFERTPNKDLGDTVSVTENGVSRDLFWGDKIKAIYLCDLSGDGIDEICTEIIPTHITAAEGDTEQRLYSSILVWDYANDKQYYLYDKNYEYWFEEYKGEDDEVKLGYHYYDVRIPISAVPLDPLTLDVMTELKEDINTEPPEGMVQTSEKIYKVFDLKDEEDKVSADLPFVFDIEGFPGVTFERNPNKELGDTLSVTENGVSRDLFRSDEITAIYLCDLSGDGKKEICAEISFGSFSAILVYDYAQNKQYILSGRKGKNPSLYNYYIQENGDSLKLVKKKYDSEFETVSDNLNSLDYFTEYDLAAYENIFEYTYSIEVVTVMPDLILSGDSELADETIEFRMEEYPGVVFRKIDADEPIDNKDRFEIELPYLDEGVFNGFPISSIYLCDLNGDGFREICLNFYYKRYAETEKSSAKIIVIDLVNDAIKILESMKFKYDYILNVVDDVLMADKYDYKTGEFISSEPLDMGDMETFLPGD